VGRTSVSDVLDQLQLCGVFEHCLSVVDCVCQYEMSRSCTDVSDPSAGSFSDSLASLISCSFAGSLNIVSVWTTAYAQYETSRFCKDVSDPSAGSFSAPLASLISCSFAGSLNIVSVWDGSGGEAILLR